MSGIQGKLCMLGHSMTELLTSSLEEKGGVGTEPHQEYKKKEY